MASFVVQQKIAIAEIGTYGKDFKKFLQEQNWVDPVIEVQKTGTGNRYSSKATLGQYIGLGYSDTFSGAINCACYKLHATILEKAEGWQSIPKMIKTERV